MRKLLILSAFVSLSACAQTTEAVNSNATPANIQAETAKYFSTSPRNVRVGSFKQTVLGTEYRAQVGSRMFDCRYMRKIVTCTNA